MICINYANTRIAGVFKVLKFGKNFVQMHNVNCFDNVSNALCSLESPIGFWRCGRHRRTTQRKTPAAKPRGFWVLKAWQ